MFKYIKKGGLGGGAASRFLMGNLKTNGGIIIMSTSFNPIKTFRAVLGFLSVDKGKKATITGVADDSKLTIHTFVKCKISGKETTKRIMAFEDPQKVIMTIEGCYTGNFSLP